MAAQDRAGVLGTDEAERLVRELFAALHGRFANQATMRQMPSVKAILEAPDEVRRDCVLRIGAMAFEDDPKTSHEARQLLSITARKGLPLEAEHVRLVFELVLDASKRPDGWQSHYGAAALLKAMIGHVERAVASLSDPERAALAPDIEEVAFGAEPAIATRLRRLINPRAATVAGGDDFGERIGPIFATSGESADNLARAFELFVSYPKSGRPPQRWFGAAGEVRSALRDPSALARRLLDALLDTSDTEFVCGPAVGVRYLVEENEPLACGIAGFAGLLGDAELIPPLRELAKKSAAFVGDLVSQPRSLRLANTCVDAIAAIAAQSSITELLALERSIRHGTFLKQIRKAIDRLAAAHGLTRAELLERAVEDHGLGKDGRREVKLSRGAAVIDCGARKATLFYLDENGKPKASFPAGVKEADSDQLAALRAGLKAIKKTLAGERQRLDEQLALEPRWRVKEWRGLYLEHPITGRLARSLIWRFADEGGEIIGIPESGQVAVTSADERAPIPGGGEVRLWHPIEATREEIEAWRLHLLEREIAQPIKQAFRELYVLTPAEAETGSYSNRFAEHVFGQVQARALMKVRGWKARPLAVWDDGIDTGVAQRDFERFGIRAELWFDPITDFHPDAGSELYPYCISDQVRFVGAESEQPMALADVPPLVFNEAMRDVDLFIGFTSIGTDPEWPHRRDRQMLDPYWESFSFGELNESAKVRREVLAHLLPRLAIADRCRLEERCLVVRGDIRTYRIHLRSGNIRMSPDDRYLCIVGTRDRRADKVFLPFDDDLMLTMILSKAFMLARDREITDPDILRQVEGDPG